MTALLCLSLALATDPDTTVMQDPVPSTAVVAQGEETVVVLSTDQAQSVSAVEQAVQLNANLTEIRTRLEELQAPVAVTESVPVERVEGPKPTE